MQESSSSFVRLCLGKLPNGNRYCIPMQFFSLTYLTLNAELSKLISPKLSFLPLTHPSIKKYLTYYHSKAGDFSHQVAGSCLAEGSQLQNRFTALVAEKELAHHQLLHRWLSLSHSGPLEDSRK